jgi:hypothetical protein
VAHFEGLAAVVAGDLLHRLGLLLDAGGRAVELEEQHRRLAQGGLAVAVDGLHGEGVEQFDAGHRHAELDGLDHRLHRGHVGKEQVALDTASGSG